MNVIPKNKFGKLKTNTPSYFKFNQKDLWFVLLYTLYIMILCIIYTLEVLDLENIF